MPDSAPGSRLRRVRKVGRRADAPQYALEQQDRGDADDDGLADAGDFPFDLDHAFDGVNHEPLADNALLDEQQSQARSQHQCCLAMRVGG